MKKIKLFLAAALACFSAGAWAQTDVTSTYITNADFEGEYSSYSKPSSDRNIYQPTGWTITYTNGEANDLTSLNSSCTQWNQFSGRAQLSTGGNNTYWIRFRWGNSEALQLSQTITLQAGQYTLSADAFFNGASNAKAEIFAGDNSKTINTANAWANYTVDFVLAETKTITIGLKLKQNSQQESVAAFDNFTLTYTAVVVKDVLETAIAAATKANAALGGSLNDAIATAQGVYDNADATQNEVNEAAATLNAAVNTAMATADNINVTDLFLKDADLSSKDGWTVNQSGSFRDQDNGLIGTYNVRFSAATVDETHLSTEYCFGFEARWSGNFASYYQTTEALPAGVYTLTYDVENVNGATSNLTYADYNYVQVGETKNYSSTTEWMAAKSSWTTHTIRVTLEEAAPITVSFGYGTGGNNTPADNTPAIYVSHVQLTYSGFLAGAKTAWEEAKAAAEQSKIDCPNVSGEELTALNEELAKAEPTTIEGYNEATAALETATATFTAAKGVYDAYAEIRSVAVALGVTPGDAPANASAAPAATHALNVAAYNATTAANIFDVTEVYAPSWSSMSTSSGQHWSGDTSISYADEWRGDTNPTERTATVTLPAGDFILMSAGRGSDNTLATMSANGTTVNFASNGDMGLGINKLGAASFDAADAAGFANKSGAAENTGTGWEWRYIPVTLSAETEITVIQKLTRLSGSAWGSFSDFRIMKKGVVADADDYAALNAAISAAETKTLGFEDGQYAPYENVAALEALAIAKAFDQTVTNEKETVEAVTAALTSATWTANDGDVDAIYNGMFATVTEGANYPDGWARTNGWGQMQSGLSGDYATAYYNQPGSLKYGTTGVYTMPLAANTAYQLTFSFRSHENGSNKGVTVSVLNSKDQGMAPAQFLANGSTTDWTPAAAYFTTGDAGNYVLVLANDGNTWMTDVCLIPFVSAQIDFDEEDELYWGDDRQYMETVNLTRTVKDGFNTVCLPFEVSAEQVANAFGDKAKVYTFQDVADGTNSTINFNTKADNIIPANTPVLIGEATASTSQTFSAVMFRNRDNYTVTGTNFDFVGTYAPMTVAENDYFIGNGAIYKSKGTTSMKAFRAYIKDKTNGQATVKMFIDGLETAIDAINADANENGVIYNIAGQRVNKAQKGIYIVNGKKVLVK